MAAKAQLISEYLCSGHFQLDGAHGLSILFETVFILTHSRIASPAGQDIDIARQVLLVVLPGLDVVAHLLRLRILFVSQHLAVGVDRIPEVHGYL